MISKHVLFVSLMLAGAPALSGCLFLGNGGGTGADGTSTDPTQQNIDEYEHLQAQLEQNRTEFMSSGYELNGIGNRLLWLDFTYFDPTLWSYDTTTQQKVHYKFSIGTGNAYGYRVSDKLVATAEVTGNGVTYHLYDITQPNTEIGSLPLSAPGNGVKWNAYAPDSTSLYYVEQDLQNGYALYRWTPGQAQATQVLTLSDATGAQLGEFWDFIVDGNWMVFIESGRVWALDLTTKKATWVGNKTESQSGITTKNGVMVNTATGPFFYSYSTKVLRDIGAAIKASGYSLNSTYSSIHEYEYDGTIHGDSVYGYVGNSGLFTFDLNAGDVKPMLLNGRDNSVIYRYPVFLDNGSVFVKGLLSESGATGADGPIYQVNWNF